MLFFWLARNLSCENWWENIYNGSGLALLRFKEGVISDPFKALADWKDDVGEVNPCSWFGIECSDGKVVVLWVLIISFFEI